MQLIDRINFWDNHIIDNVSNSLYSRFDLWLASHPLIDWLLDHPLISIVLSLVVTVLIIRLLVTIYRGIASVIDKMWLWILRSPFLLLKLLFGWEVKSKSNATNTTIINHEASSLEQLQEILICLKRLQQQQEEIVRDIELLKNRAFGANAIETKADLLLSKKEI